MSNKVANLALVSNVTFEASKAVNLHHYDLSSALQTSLEFNQLVTIFSEKIQSLIPHSGFEYFNNEFGIAIKNGIITRNSCSYALKVEEQQLGELKFMRRQKFDPKEMDLLESLLCCLIYPLKNATLYHQAIDMAFNDPLTNTRNRTSFNECLRREIQLAHRNHLDLAVIFLDIDHFKRVNDIYGHQCGDAALVAIAKWIKESIRGSDILYRYGGEEFVILLSDTDKEGAELLAERVRSNIENHTLAFDMGTLKLTASLGISHLRTDDQAEQLVSRADEAMYTAKKLGRNRVVIR